MVDPRLATSEAASGFEFIPAGTQNLSVQELAPLHDKRSWLKTAVGLGMVGVATFGMNSKASALDPSDCTGINVPEYINGVFIGCAVYLPLPPGQRPPGPGQGNTPPKPRPAVTTTTQPHLGQRDEDGDGFSVTYNIDTGEIVSMGYEANDHSPGIGEAGLTEVKADMLARGLDPATLTGEQTIIALSTSPDGFSKSLASIYDVTPTTPAPTEVAITPSPTNAPSTEQVVPDSASVTELDNTSVATSSTLRLIAAGTGQSSSPESTDSHELGIILAGLVTAAAVGGVALIARRHDKQEINPQLH